MRMSSPANEAPRHDFQCFQADFEFIIGLVRSPNMLEDCLVDGFKRKFEAIRARHGF